MLSIKQQLYSQCQQFLLSRMETAQHAIADAQASANEETKSSSGDKYETGRAMMQLEMEKYNTQLQEVLKLKQALDQIKVDEQYFTVQPGSLAITTEGNFFIGTSVGKIVIDNKTYFAVSPSSPIAVKLLGTKANDSFAFNNKQYTIQEVW